MIAVNAAMADNWEASTCDSSIDTSMAANDGDGCLTAALVPTLECSIKSSLLLFYLWMGWEA